MIAQRNEKMLRRIGKIHSLSDSEYVEYAVDFNSTDCIVALEEMGASTSSQQLLVCAIAAKNDAVFDFLVDRHNVSRFDDAVLVAAVTYGDYLFVKKVLERCTPPLPQEGPDFDATSLIERLDRMGYTANYGEVRRKLVCIVDAGYGVKDPCLVFLAAAWNDFPLLKCLIELGASPNNAGAIAIAEERRYFRIEYYLTQLSLSYGARR
jgi:hypothetical protein